MDERIITQLKEICDKQVSSVDSLLYKGQPLEIDISNFNKLDTALDNKEIYFIDGGQAELLVAGNFALQYLRVAAVSFLGSKKQNIHRLQAYCLTKTKIVDGEICYYANLYFDGRKIEGVSLSNAELSVSSTNELVRSGSQRAAITKLGGIARRFLELKLAKKIALDDPSCYVVLDGSLDSRYPGEQGIVDSLPANVSGLAKTTQLFTVNGGSPTVYLSQICPLKNASWSYSFTDDLHFAKLHSSSRHVFRFDGNKEILKYLTLQSSDPVFLGYPYGLILVDRLARVSEQDKSRLRGQFLLRRDLVGLKDQLASQDAHEILDRVG